MNKLNSIISILVILSFVGCATGGFQADVVARDAAGKSQYVQTGVVTQVRSVIIEGDREVGATSGTVLGAIVGAGAAERAAGGDGETSEQIGAIVGGLVGSVVGSEVGESISRKKGVEIIIKLDSNNREVAIVQEASEDEAQEVKAGDKVRIIRSAGRSRVVPYN